ncbi:restriction endonuclease subunit S [Rhodanobacter terrae]|uniref:Restriction endonuclease subunit S n=1 Tax=Rhodanobacter terrae TaxID=418647 RepID=A0ABW0T0W2_9GAMM
MEVKEACATYDAPITMSAGYKQTEVGIIPEDWTIASLSTISAFITKGATPTTYGFKWEQEGILFLRSECVAEDGLDLSQSMRISDAAHATLGRSQVTDGDILVTITGNVGRAIFFRSVEPANINQHIARVRIRANTKADFVYHFLTLPQCRARFNSITTGQAYPQISLKQVREAPIAIPPSRAEQEAIAEALSDADALIESLEQLIAKKRQIKQGTMQALLTGKQRLPSFDGKWHRKALSELFDFSGGYSASRDQLSTEGHCYLHYGDIHMSTKSFVDVTAERQELPKLDISLNKVNANSLLKDGDVVFVDASEDDDGTSKHVVIINRDNAPFISGLHTIVAKSKTDELDHAFRRYCFQTSDIKQQFRFFAVGTKVSGVSKSNIGKIELSMPPSDEQRAIATILTDMDTELAELETRLTKTRQLKQGMMQELLTGRIRLVQPASNVIPLPEKTETRIATARSHNRQINEAIVIAALVNQFGSEDWPLARVRRTKLAYLLHRHAEGRADGFLKKAAGPYDPRTRYKGPEGIALKKAYVRSLHNGTYEGFVASKNISEAEAYFEKWYGADVVAWLEQFRLRKTDELELLTTVDMAVEDLRREGKSISVDSVKQLIQDNPEWKPKLDRPAFSDAAIAGALAECQTLFAS